MSEKMQTYLHRQVDYGELVRVPKVAGLTLFVIIILLSVFVGWASFAKIDEAAKGEGRVIPSRDIQIVQSLEGGIVKDILVHEGDIVEKGEILIRIDDTGFASTYEEKRSKYLSLQARIARLEAESLGETPQYPEEVTSEGKNFVENEKRLYEARKQEMNSSVAILEQQIERKNQEVAELMRRQEKLKESLFLVKEELDLTTPLAVKNIIPQVELLALKRQVNQNERDIDAAVYQMLNAQSDRKEAEERIKEQLKTFSTEVAEELSQLRQEYDALESTIKASADVINRTQIRSPVKGTIKQLLVKTVGGVVRPAMDIVEVVPLEDNLLIEAKIKPSDIAFVYPGQDTVVKLTAYDFSIYGGLKAKVEHISADTIVDEEGNSFFKIRVRTQKSYLGTDDDPLPIIPGMVASVDIITGNKTIMTYLLKPLKKARDNALRER